MKAPEKSIEAQFAEYDAGHYQDLKDIIQNYLLNIDHIDPLWGPRVEEQMRRLDNMDSFRHTKAEEMLWDPRVNEKNISDIYTALESKHLSREQKVSAIKNLLGELTSEEVKIIAQAANEVSETPLHKKEKAGKVSQGGMFAAKKPTSSTPSTPKSEPPTFGKK